MGVGREDGVVAGEGFVIGAREVGAWGGGKGEDSGGIRVHGGGGISEGGVMKITKEERDGWAKRARVGMTRSVAIRRYCLECAGGNTVERLICHLEDCPLWNFRTGRSIKFNEERLKDYLEKNPATAKERKWVMDGL